MNTLFGANTTSSLDDIAHIIQIALTPVFLLSGIAALLNVFSSRLARVADRADLLMQRMETSSRTETIRLSARLAYFHRRTRTLDAAVLLGAVGGGATCLAAMTLFVGALRDTAGATVLFVSFGAGLLCTMGALAAFLIEMLMASHGLRDEVEHRRSKANPDEALAEAETHHAEAQTAGGPDSDPGPAS